jgi:hypothetical protein
MATGGGGTSERPLQSYNSLVVTVVPNRTDVSSTSSNSRRNTPRFSTYGNTVLLNFGLSLAMFFALVQVFDPTVRRQIETDVRHHHLNHNPIVQSLEVFSQGLEHGSFLNDTQQTLTRSNGDRIITLLKQAGIADELSDRQMEQLPQWDQVSSSL